ncbi:MAG: HEAT repeat domain-containing protein [Aggregatilineales bacterium]
MSESHYSPDDIENKLESQRPGERRLGVIIAGKLRLYQLARHIVSIMHHDSDSEVRAMAAWSLDMLGSPDTVPELIGAMYDGDFGVRSNAGWALVHMAKRITPDLILPDVIDVLRDMSNPDARQMAYLVLSRIGGEHAHDAIQCYWYNRRDNG